MKYLTILILLGIISILAGFLVGTIKLGREIGIENWEFQKQVEELKQDNFDLGCLITTQIRGLRECRKELKDCQQKLEGKFYYDVYEK
jgi:hypothetical protein